MLSAERAALEIQLRGALERERVRRGLRRAARRRRRTPSSPSRRTFAGPNAELAAVAPEKVAGAAEAAGLLVPINQVRCVRPARPARVGSAPARRSCRWPCSVATGRSPIHAFVGAVRETLAGAGLEPAMLELDVTEDMLLYDSARAAGTLTALKSLGVVVAVDAFGTGKASFADLQRFPIAALKLHPSRIDGIAFDLDKQRYAEGVIALGQALGLKVVATGVATAADADFLRAHRLRRAAGADRAAVVVGRRMRGAAARASLDFAGGDRQEPLYSARSGAGPMRTACGTTRAAACAISPTICAFRSTSAALDGVSARLGAHARHDAARAALLARLVGGARRQRVRLLARSRPSRRCCGRSASRAAGAAKLTFEEPLPTGLPGDPPTADVALARPDGRCVAIESKFAEWLVPRPRSKRVFKDKYFPAAGGDGRVGGGRLAALPSARRGAARAAASG